MRRILIASCEQEISSFNPLASEYAAFTVLRGQEIFRAHANADTCLRGAIDVLGGEGDLELLPTYAASACSAGPLSARGFDQLVAELLDAVRAQAAPIDGVYLSLHGAMGALNEPDPEGVILSGVRKFVGPSVPIVVSMDLHGILTERMLSHCDAIAVYHTYPHDDFTSTGRRAANLLLRILNDGASPVMARVFVPALVRGHELDTSTGLFGKVTDRANQMETSGEAMSAAFLIGNPFTDAPELGSQALVVTDADPARAERLALELTDMFWADHERMLATLVSLDDAIAEAAHQAGPVTFTDAADAISSGASGDSNAILAGLVAVGYNGRAIVPIVDAPAARAAHEAGVGATLTLPLGGTVDPSRFPPLLLEVEVERLGDGEYDHEFSRLPAHAGPTAVLRHRNMQIVVVTHPIFMMDRSIFLAHGLDPEKADIIVVKSPGAATRFFTFASRNYVLDTPGSTSANLRSLGHRACPRPMFPLDDVVPFAPAPQIFPTSIARVR